MISLGLNGDTKTVSQYEDTIQKQLQETDGIKEEIVQARQEKFRNTSENGPVVASAEESIRLRVQCDIYKELYESLLTRVMAY